MEQIRLYREREKREKLRKDRERQSDHLNEMLREALGLAIEFPQRQEVEDRLRLLLNLERAERILIANQLIKPGTIKVTMKRWSLKELLMLQDELLRAGAATYKEKSREQNWVWLRYQDFVHHIQRWSHEVEQALNGAGPSTVKQLIEYQREMQRFFPYTSLPVIPELTKRVQACHKCVLSSSRACVFGWLIMLCLPCSRVTGGCLARSQLWTGSCA